MLNRKFINIIILFYLFTIIIAFFININFLIKKKYILDSGIMLWYNQPSAIYYNNYLYYSYLGLDKSVKIGKFGKNYNESKSIFSYSELDDHGSPSIWIIQNGKEKGKILSFYSLHSSEMYFSKSKQKENISDWEDLKIFDNRKITYNSIGETSDGKIFVFYTVQSPNNRSYVYKESIDGANTWSEAKVLINFGNEEYIYATPVLIKDKHITVSFTSYRSKDPNIGHKNIYLLRSDDSGNNWYQSNDKNKLIDLPLLKENAIPILKTNIERENVIWDLKYDKDYQPIIAYIDHAPFSNEGWDDTKAKIISFDKNNNTKVNFLSDISSFVYPSGVRIDPNNTNNFILGIRYQNKSRFVYFNNNLEYKENTFLNIFNYSNEYEMNPIYPQNTNGKYIIYMDVNKYFKKNYDSKIILIQNGFLND